MKLNTYIKKLSDLLQTHGNLEVVRGFETARSRQHFDSGFEENPSPASTPEIKGIEIREDTVWGNQEIIVHPSKKHSRKVVYIA